MSYLIFFLPELFVFCFATKNIKVKIYRIKIINNVSFEGKTWSLILTEFYRLREFQNKVLRK
jgi:hypothetical protein